jgi:hypothetical protein
MFDSAAKKIDWAEEHIRNLRERFRIFADSNPYSFLTKADPKTGDLTFSLRFQNPMPPEFGLIIGDAIHNLRTALDHMTWELIGLDNGTQDGSLHFPSREVRNDFEAVCDGIKTPRADTKAFFKGLAVYIGGQRQSLNGICILDNSDKHKIITPLVSAGSVSNFRIINPDGSVGVTFGTTTVAIGPDGYFNIMRMRGGATLELDNNTKATPEVFFDQIKVFPFHAIIPTLTQLVNDVRNVREAFLAFVAKRPNVV